MRYTIDNSQLATRGDSDGNSRRSIFRYIGVKMQQAKSITYALLWLPFTSSTHRERFPFSLFVCVFSLRSHLVLHQHQHPAICDCHNVFVYHLLHYSTYDYYYYCVNVCVCVYLQTQMLIAHLHRTQHMRCSANDWILCFVRDSHRLPQSTARALSLLARMHLQHYVSSTTTMLCVSSMLVTWLK